MDNTVFSGRIKYRHNKFWSPADAEIIRNTIMDASYAPEKWKNVENWQRKLSNKYNSRQFASMHGCRVPELYWRGRDCNQIDFSSLPAHYVIRPTIGHSCKSVFLMKNGRNLMDGRSYPDAEIIKALNKALADDHYQEFLIEEFVRTEEAEYKIPNDYKFYMFNGELAFVQVINRFNRKKGFTSFYDKAWNLLENVNSIYKQAADLQVKPRCFDEMYAYAVSLSKTYEIFVRIDFYATDKGAVFGEFTPTPGLGAAFTPFGDKLLINYWDQFCKGMI
ncbi:hypothetical protein I2I11_05450 [Pontibacter sp. 172403-2]|nr:hypothetical protein [Pontibacter sp. 172403-2]